MNRKKEYVSVERERIAELIAKIDNLWILRQIYMVIVNVTKEGGDT